jgi:synovial sarcoma, X breakpoint 2 interacting protein
MQSDISRLEAKIERLDAQLAAKDRELATLTRTVCSCVNSCFRCLINVGILNFFLKNQEAKNTAALKAQIDKLQQERDEFQKMVIGNQVSLP